MNFYNLKIALRFSLRTKLFTFINMIGLALGFAGFILAYLYINYEKSYDSWNPNYENIYLIGLENQGKTDLTPIGLGKTIKDQLPEIVEMGRVNYFPYEVPFNSDEDVYFIKSWVGADVSIARMFNMETQGMPLENINIATTFIRQDIATKLFHENMNVQNEWVVMGNKENGLPLQLSGTVKGFPGLSNIEFEIIGFMEDLGSDLLEEQDVKTFIQVKEGTDISALILKINRVFEKTVSIKNDNTAISANSTLYLDPLKNLHLQPKHGSSTGYKIIIVLGLLSSIILVLAAINFANLMIVQAQKRAKEISIKKIFGVSQKRLVIQFFIEAFIQCFLAACIALFLVNIVINVLVNNFAYDLAAFQFEKAILWQLTLAVLLTSLVSGMYPAIILSHKKSIRLIQGRCQTSHKSQSFRHALLGFQFIIAFGFINMMMVINRQMDFMNKVDRGFNIDQVVYIKNLALFNRPSEFGQIRSRMKEIQGIEKITVATSLPGGHAPQAEEWVFRDKSYKMDFIGVDFEYFETLGISLLDGRVFSSDFPADSLRSIILNETAAQAFGIKTIGERVSGFGENYEVVGIVKDSKMQGFEELIRPTIYSIHNPSSVPKVQIMAKMKDENLAANLTLLSKRWKTINKKDGDYFIYEFVDQKYASLFAKQNQLKSAFTHYTVLIVLVALIGLFGMAAFSIQSRQKEIGIRKILGASGKDVLLLLNKPFLKIAMISILISTPTAWYLSSHWLQTFAYKIELQGWYFAVGTAVSLAIAFITVSVQAIKATYLNPVEALHED